MRGQGKGMRGGVGREPCGVGAETQAGSQPRATSGMAF